MTAALAARWARLGGAAALWRDRVAAAYSEPHRRYHTLAHLEAMFAEAAPFEPLPRALEWAIWFHDFVYDPRSATNEADSAAVARQALAEMGEPGAVTGRAAELILVTRHGAGAVDDAGDDARLLVSLDLSILAASEARYDAYAEAIRTEYAHVPEEQFRAGRAAFLQQMLAAGRPPLFPHPAFTAHQARARANLAREIRRLSLLG